VLHVLYLQSVVEDVIPYIIVEALIAFLAICSNGLVLLAICRFKSLQSTTYKLIGSLAAADIAVALLANSSGIVLRLSTLFHNILTYFSYRIPETTTINGSDLCG